MDTFTLFPELEDITLAVTQYNATQLPAVQGLQYQTDFITPGEEAELLHYIDQQPWLDDLQRRVQHYGYKYDYRSRKIDASMEVGPLPDCMVSLGKRLLVDGHMDCLPDQVIVNEYQPGQGISAHVDCEPCFGESIVSLTLGSGCMMDFTQRGLKGAVSVYLAPRSVVVLSQEARYKWMHSIAKRQKDEILEHIIPRSRRVSLTFRAVILQNSA